MNLHISATTWEKNSVRLRALRHEVFVIEQNVPEELEWDEFDAAAIHFACEDASSGDIVGTARLVTENNKVIIGRLCVAQRFRRQKIATRLMAEILAYCKFHRFSRIELHAQLYLKKFYAGLGFIEEGVIYMEAGIEHITMVRQL